jgi:hypothetical protein
MANVKVSELLVKLRAPPTRKERITSAVLGGFAGFWIAVLCRLFFGTLPASLSAVAAVGLWGLLAGVLLGIIFPKTTRWAALPFAFYGVGGGGP